MNKRIWIVPLLIVAVNALAIALRWGSLSDPLPAHFDLDGNASGEMPRNMLLMYPLIAAGVCGLSYLVARFKNKFNTPLVILSSGISLILLFSTMVTLTAGKAPIFMLAEPVILLASVVDAVICILRLRKA